MNQISEVLSEFSNPDAKKEIEDYINPADGLVYCGKCHTPRQGKFMFNGVEHCVWGACKCELDEYERTRKELKRQEQERIMQFRLKECFAGYEKYQDATFQIDDRKSNPETMHIIYGYAQKFDEFYPKGIGLLIYGSVGSGKTFYASCIANDVIQKGYSARITNLSRILQELWNEKEKQAYLNTLNSYDLLILDDYGVERKTDYTNQIITSVIDARLNSGLPLIITTNKEYKTFENPQSLEEDRIFSRLRPKCYPVMHVGRDRRISQNTIFEDFKNILG